MQDDLLIQMVEAVEAQGGELLPETHYPYPIIYKIPRPNGRPPKASEIQSTGCGHAVMFRIPYETEDESTEVGQIKACAICDGAALWPRFDIDAEPDTTEAVA